MRTQPGRTLFLIALSCASLLSGPAWAVEGRAAPKAGTRYLVRGAVRLERTGGAAGNTETVARREVTSSDGWSWRASTTVVGETRGPSNEPASLETVLRRNHADNGTRYQAFLPVNIHMQAKVSFAGDLRDAVSDQDYDCDWDRLRSLFPLGHVPSVELACSMASTTNGKVDGPHKITYTLTDEGASTVTVPAGTFPIRRVRSVGRSTSDVVFETTYWFSDAIGLTIVSDSRVVSPGFSMTTRSELTELD